VVGLKVLIIGGSRFVGPLLVEKLLRKGHELTLFNRGNNQSTYSSKVKFVKGDRNNGFNLRDHFDVVIDTCAYTPQQAKKAVEELNFDFMVHFGTAASYAETELFPLSENTSVVGEWPIWGDYNKGKVACERVLEKSKASFASIRPVYVLGPKNYCDREHFIYSRIKKEQPLTLPGNGRAVVQFVFADEVAESILVLAEGKHEGAFNCAGNEVITLNGLVSEMGKIVGKKPIVKFNPRADGIGFKEEEFPFANENFFCSNEKIKKLGVKFKPLVSGLKKDFEEYYKKVI